MVGSFLSLLTAVAFFSLPVFPRLSRVRATLLVGALSSAFIFAGRFGLNLVQSISTFATVIITCTTPWMVVTVLGHWTRRGWYDPDALQVFNRRQRGGRYWFARGGTGGA